MSDKDRERERFNKKIYTDKNMAGEIFLNYEEMLKGGTDRVQSNTVYEERFSLYEGVIYDFAFCPKAYSIFRT